MLPGQRAILYVHDALAGPGDGALDYLLPPRVLVSERAIPRAALERAVAALSRRHPALRARFVWRCDGWRQQIMPVDSAAPLAFRSVAVGRGRRNADAIAIGLAAVAELVLEQPAWDIRVPRLMRIAAVEIAGRTIVVMFVHQLIADPASLDLLAGELAAALDRLVRGHRLDAAAEATPYDRFAALLRAFDHDRLVAEELGFWEQHAGKRLAGAAEVTSASAGEVARVVLPAALTARIRGQLTAELGCTTAQLLVAAVLRATGAPRVYTTHPGRSVAGFDLGSTVGRFATALPVRAELAAPWPELQLAALGAWQREVERRSSGIGFGMLRFGPRWHFPRPAWVFHHAAGDGASRGTAVLQPAPAGCLHHLMRPLVAHGHAEFAGRYHGQFRSLVVIDRAGKPLELHLCCRADERSDALRVAADIERALLRIRRR